MNGELLSILAAIERDKGIDREILIQAVESALATAARKTTGASEEQPVTVTIDRKTGHVSVVSDDQEVSSIDFSRIAAQTAKQVIIQKIREAEREVVFTEFQGRMGDIVTGTIHRFERGDIIVELGRAEAVVPKSERIPHEEYHQGDRVQGYVLEVRKTMKGPAIVLSRTHEGFIRGLFALEVPEVSEGIVEIKGLAREAGDRTKIAVASKDERVDCVGACVGMRGTRVKNIVRELHGEKVDIIRWHEEIKEYIAAALSPAKISEIQGDAAAKQAVVVVDDDQLSLAIGKRGQNVRLASKLTGWQLEIKSKGQLAEAKAPLRSLPGVGPTTEQKLVEAGVTSVAQLAAMTVEQLSGIKGIGEKTAQKMLEAAHRAMSQAAQPSDGSASVDAEASAPTSAAPASGQVAAELPASAETSETSEPPAIPAEEANLDAGAADEAPTVDVEEGSGQDEQEGSTEAGEDEAAEEEGQDDVDSNTEDDSSASQ
jgi:N utilization substance protein A